VTTARPASHPEPVPHESVAHRVPAPLRPLVWAGRFAAPRRWLAEEQMLGTDGG